MEQENVTTDGTDANIEPITESVDIIPPTPEPETTTIEANADDTAVDESKSTPTPPAVPAQPDETKAVSYNEIMSAVHTAVNRALNEGNDYGTWPDQIMVYEGYVIVSVESVHYRANYTITDGRVELQPRAEWTRVEGEWVEAKRIENTVISFGSGVKALGAGMVGGYLVKFTDPDNPDLEDDFFDAETDYGPHEKTLVYYQHGLDETLGVKRLGSRYANGLGELKMDNVGVWFQHQLDLADEYEAAVYRLSELGKMRLSSGTATHLVRRELKTGAKGRKAYHIKTWPLGLDASYTPTPAAGPGHTKVTPLKSYLQDEAATLPGLKALLQEVKAKAAPTSTAGATAPSAGSGQAAPGTTPDGKNQSTKTIQLEDFNMEPEELKTLIAGAVTEVVQPLADKVTALEAKLAAEPPHNDTGFNIDSNPGDDAATKAASVMYNLRYAGKDDEATKFMVMDELAGGNYKQFVLAQNMAFAKYLRGGTDMMEVGEVKLLKNQLFAPSYVIGAVKDGMMLAELKDTMVEAQGSLGGYAVPPNVQENVARRLPGLTAVRGNGARVITLIRGNSVEVPVYTGGNDRYTGNIRGQWGTETQSPTEQNATLGMETVIANIYTYKVPMSQSLVEDAGNLVSLVEDDIVMVLAMDEDEAFLVGNGVGKPLGWLPGGANTLSLNSVKSGSASTVLTPGIKALKRGVASQYRARGVFVANSDTYGVVEALTVSGTGSDFAFEDLSETGQLLRRPAVESEAMPDIAGAALPILFVDMSGYYIVDRAGLTVMRMQDSGTGINKVELHVRKRVGGRPVETWKAAVQLIST